MFKKLAQAGRSVIEYFYTALLAYADGDEAAGLAMIATAMAVEKRARERMLLHASLLEDRAPHIHPVLLQLSERDWNVGDSSTIRLTLRKTSPEYYRAMSNWYGKADPTVFHSTHPKVRELSSLIRNLADLVYPGA